MNLSEAKIALSQGEKVKLPEWSGYWFNDSTGKTYVFTKDGNIEETPWFEKYTDRQDFEVTEGTLGYDVAIRALKNGRIVAREGWNGKGMWLFMQIGNTVPASFIPNFKSLPENVKQKLADRGTDVVFNSSITMMTATGELQPGWLASQSDMLAEDWEVLQ